MGLKKCPRCELNYIRDDEKLCNVCRRSAKLSDESEEEIMCIECGEHPAIRGKDLYLIVDICNNSVLTV